MKLKRGSSRLLAARKGVLMWLGLGGVVDGDFGGARIGEQCGDF